jgi:hypothetical protein
MVSSGADKRQQQQGQRENVQNVERFIGNFVVVKNAACEDGN